MTNPGILKRFKVKRALEKVGKPTVSLKFKCQFHLTSNSYKGQWQMEDLTEVSKTELKCLCVQFVEKILNAPKVLLTLSSTLRNLLKQLFQEKLTFFIPVKECSQDLRLQTSPNKESV